MKLFILASCLLVKSLAFPHVEITAEEWQNFKSTYGKQYKSHEEELLRQKIYLENKQFIESHNKLYERGEVTFKLGMNRFGDMRNDEVRSTMMGFKPSGLSNKMNTRIHINSNKTLPASVDWRSKNVVTPVKSQGQCGSCWAFSATGALEGQMALKTGKLVSLSEQNLMDCDIKDGNNGCSGGSMDLAFTYIKENGGIDTEASYPYTGEDGTCKFKSSDVGGTDMGHVDIASGNLADLQDAIANIGPISVAFDSSHASFNFYTGGIYNPSNCSTERLHHGVIAIGYGRDQIAEGYVDYWLFKNSWGIDWGEEGFFRMIRNGQNICGIATNASYPTV